MTDLSAVTATPSTEATPIAPPADVPAALSPVIETDSEAKLNAELNAVWEKNNPDPNSEPAEAPEKATSPAKDPITGKFVSSKPANPAETKTTDQPAPLKPETVKPSIEAPNAWSAEMKAKWATLPPDAQAYIAQREGEAHQAITRAGEEKARFEPTRKLLESGRELYQSLGISQEQALNAMFNVEKGLRTNPTETIHNLAKAYGVDLSGMKPGQPANAEVTQLRNELAEMKSYLTAQQRAAFEASQDELARSIVDFSQGEGKDFWAEVEADIAPQIHALKSQHPDWPADKLLKQAYQNALHVNEGVRTKRETAARKAEADARAAEEAKRVLDARKSAGTNIVGMPANVAPKDNDAELRAIALKHYGRAR